jgi:hypothetical protein
MTYYVDVINQTAYDFETSNGVKLPAQGGQWNSGLIGDAWVSSPTWGPMSFLDIGHDHIGGDSGGEWGMLLSYQSEEVVGRYDGSPVLTVTIDKYGAATVTPGGDFTLRQVYLPGLTIAGT